jgi:hypothetical protein
VYGAWFGLGCGTVSSARFYIRSASPSASLRFNSSFFPTLVCLPDLNSYGPLHHKSQIIFVLYPANPLKLQVLLLPSNFDHRATILIEHLLRLGRIRLSVAQPQQTQHGRNGDYDADACAREGARGTWPSRCCNRYAHPRLYLNHASTRSAQLTHKSTDPNAVLKDKVASWRYGRAPDYTKTRAYWQE